MSFDGLSLSSHTIPAPAPIEPTEKRRRWFELCLIVFLAFSGSVLRAMETFRNGPLAVTEYGAMRWLNVTFHKVGILLLLGYVLWRGGRSFHDIGFRWSIKDAVLGIPLYAVFRALYFCSAFSIGHVHYAFFGVYPPHNTALQVFGHMPLVALLDILINPFYEELVVRAYLMTEIRSLSGSMALAAAISLILQTSYHLYYGWWIGISIGLSFVAFAAYFAKSRRALPIVVAHAIADIVGFVRLQ